ncbi:HD domain-containing phosphohydrolase [Rhodococcus sp. NPDC003318]|uniref:HD domain-containing phosphohydrolase n=1 Tax=Rhodococcus sp. NPDC003318 TaxID=3364503 RepID=UPI00367F1289
MEHMLRSSLIATRLADRIGVGAADRGAAYYGTLVGWIGCHADSHELAALVGDDIAFRADTYDIEMVGVPMLRLILRHAGEDASAWTRGLRAVAFTVTARSRLTDLISSHCASARVLADRVGLDGQVGEALAFTFERWDGRGLPAGVRGDAIPLPSRMVAVADVAEVHLRAGGPVRSVEVVRARRGSQFCPRVVDAFVADAAEITGGLLDCDVWSEALDQAPDRDRRLSGDELDAFLGAMGEFVDLKCPYLLGHSRAVAESARAAARHRGMSDGEQRRLYRAGLVHGLGRMGVSNRIWEKSGALTASEWERVRLYPYLTGRILSRVEGLADVVAVAAAHRERLDGSGFPRGTTAADLDPAARMLAAADAYQRLREPRPYRPAYTPDEAAEVVRGDARAGRLEPEAVDAVLAAAGHRAARRSSWPAGLTDREVQVLRLVAQGYTNREIAAQFVISEKTVRNHVERIYGKLGVRNRIQASLAAIDHGLARYPAGVGPGE